MRFELTILGTSAAVPTKDRYLSGQVLNIHDELYLIDCGEGTQLRLSACQIKRSKIHHVFISHLHGDHFFGLFGLLTSLGMMGRVEPLHIYSPEGLEEIVKVMFKNSFYQSPFDIRFHTVSFSDNIDNHSVELLSNNRVTVSAFPLSHRIPAMGFVFREKKLPKHIIPEKIAEYQIPFSLINDIKKGADFSLLDSLDPSLRRDAVIPNHELTLDSLEPRSFAYCSDTRYFEPLIPHIKGVDLLYHEATFAHEMAAHADLTGHSTALQAAMIAAKAEVKKLIIGHFSSRYERLDGLLHEAQHAFGNTVIALDGQTYSVDFFLK